MMGYQVTVFESLHALGGVLSYGIPEFRLPKAIVAARSTTCQPGRGVATRLRHWQDAHPDSLKESFDAVFVGSGAGLP